MYVIHNNSLVQVVLEVLLVFVVLVVHVVLLVLVVLIGTAHLSATVGQQSDEQ